MAWCLTQPIFSSVPKNMNFVNKTFFSTFPSLLICWLCWSLTWYCEARYCEPYIVKLGAVSLFVCAINLNQATHNSKHCLRHSRRPHLSAGQDPKLWQPVALSALFRKTFHLVNNDFDFVLALAPLFNKLHLKYFFVIFTQLLCWSLCWYMFSWYSLSTRCLLLLCLPPCLVK